MLPVTMVTRSLSAWQYAHGLHPSHLGWEPVTAKIASSTLTKGSWQLGGGGGGWRGWGDGWESAAGSRTHLGQTGSKEHTLEELPHPLEELVHVWALQHIHLQREEMTGISHTAAGRPGHPELPQGASSCCQAYLCMIC